MSLATDPEGDGAPPEGASAGTRSESPALFDPTMPTAANEDGVCLSGTSSAPPDDRIDDDDDLTDELPRRRGPLWLGAAGVFAGVGIALFLAVAPSPPELPPAPAPAPAAQAAAPATPGAASGTPVDPSLEAPPPPSIPEGPWTEAARTRFRKATSEGPAPQTATASSPAGLSAADYAELVMARKALHPKNQRPEYEWAVARLASTYGDLQALAETKRWTLRGRPVQGAPDLRNAAYVLALYTHGRNWMAQPWSRALVKQSDTPELHYAAALAHAKDDPKRAEHHAARALALQPSMIDAALLLAGIRLGRDAPGAEDDLMRLAFASGDLDVMAQAAASLRDAGRYRRLPEVMEVLSRREVIARISPAQRFTLAQLALSHRLLRGDPQGALAMATIMVAERPTSPQPAIALARLQAMLDRPFDATLAAARKKMKKPEERGALALEHLRLHLQRQDLTRARALLNDLRAPGLGGWLRLGQGLVLLAEGRLPGAKRRFEAAAEVRESRPYAALSLARLHPERGAQLQAVVERFSAGQARLELAMWLDPRGIEEELRRSLDELAWRDPVAEDPWQLVTAWLEAVVRSRDYADAHTYARALHDAAPQDPRWLRALAHLAERDGDVSAQRYWTARRERTPGSWRVAELPAPPGGSP